MNRIKRTHADVFRSLGFATSLFFAIATCIGILCTSPQVVHAAPLTCTSAFYQIMGGQLKVLNAEDGSYDSIGAVIPDVPNALGYNVEDNYLYALVNTGANQGHLLRIEGDGSYTDLGIPAGLPVASYVAGDFDDEGNLWVSPFGTTSTLYRIDVSAGTTTSLALSDGILISELVHINGVLYGQGGYYLRRIDTDTGILTSAAVTGMPSGFAANSPFGAGWATVQDELYFSHNVTGIIWKITDYDTEAPLATALIQGEIPSSNDGAACAGAASPIEDLAAVNDSRRLDNGTRTLSVSVSSGLLRNDSGQEITVTGYTQPTRGTVTVNADGSFEYVAPAGFSGTTTFTYTITDEFGQERTATVTIRVSSSGAAASSQMLADTGANSGLVIIIAATLFTSGASLIRNASRLKSSSFYKL